MPEATCQLAWAPSWFCCGNCENLQQIRVTPLQLDLEQLRAATNKPGQRIHKQAQAAARYYPS